MEENFSERIAVVLKNIFFWSLYAAHPFALQVHFGLMLWTIMGAWSACFPDGLVCVHIPVPIDSVPRDTVSASKSS